MKKWLPVAALACLLGVSGFAIVKLGLQPDGSYLVSSGQRIQLLGTFKRLDGFRPKDMCLSPDGKQVALLTHRRLMVMLPDGTRIADAAISAGPLGVAWAPDGKTIYASLGTGKIGTYSLEGDKLTVGKDIAVEPADAKGNPGTCGIVVGSEGTIYAALSIRNKIVAISPAGEIYNTWQTEASPYHLALNPGGDILIAANRGGAVIAPSPEQGDPNSREPFQGIGAAYADSAGTKVQIDPRTDAALKGSLTLVKIKTKMSPITIPSGRQPSGMTFSKDGQKLYVANSDEDTISIFDLKSMKEALRFPIAPKEDSTFGQIPTDVALNSDEKRLFVALGGANSIAVVENTEKPKVLGYVPTAWYPISLEMSNDQLMVGCSKGIGSQPASKTTSFGVHDNVGGYQMFTAKEMGDLKKLTSIVAKNNSWTNILQPRKGIKPVPVPERIGEPSVFKHVIYIIKENLTYDVAMGDIKEGNGDPSLCVFGENVSPNHHALAKQFGLLDNFYISGTNSADGHQWVASSIANGYTEQNYSANARSYPYDGGDPLAFSPEGFLWTQAIKGGKSVRVFGEFVDKPSVIDSKTGKNPDWKRCWEDYKSGKGEVVIKAGTSQAIVRDNMNQDYIGFPSSVSDQYRADVFIKELQDWEKKGKMPDFSIMLLPNDHTVGVRANWPTPRAAVADNDLALGRIIEAISKSKFWNETLVIVAQDDSQNGTDHVDGHRSIAFCVSAYSKPGTNSTMFNHATIASTIGRVLGLQPLTRFDRTAKPMSSCFNGSPSQGPYQAVKNIIPLDELTPPAKSLSAQLREFALACEKMDWSEVDTQDQTILNQAIWAMEAPRSVGKKGYSLADPRSRGAKFNDEEDDDD